MSRSLTTIAQAGSSPAETLRQARAELSATQAELARLRRLFRPLWLVCPALGWLPVVGGDLAAAPALLETAEGVVDGGLLLTGAGQGVVAGGQVQTGQAAALLHQALPELAAAQSRLAEAELAFDEC